MKYYLYSCVPIHMVVDFLENYAYQKTPKSKLIFHGISDKTVYVSGRIFFNEKLGVCDPLCLFGSELTLLQHRKRHLKT
jgi:hypothetical protein